MEFVQFHPTGMVWPLSVRGTLVTEAVRGEGGILTNSQGERFMFKNIPENYRKETADTIPEAERWLKGDKSARRPPELLTRDVVARAITKEVNAGRGSPHGGAFLDIASRLPAAEIKKKLPSMYHQFKQLADVDITKEPMEVAPTAHYMMGGVRVHPESQESTIPGLFAAGECSGGMHGSNRLGGNSLSDILVFGQRAGFYAAQSAQKRGSLSIDKGQVETAIKEMLEPLERREGKSPYDVFEKLQDIMSRYVNISREEEEMKVGLAALESLQEEIKTVKALGGKEFNPGWHTALDLKSLITVSLAITRAAFERKESRGGHSRRDYPKSDDGKWGKLNVVISRKNGVMGVTHSPLPEMPDELKELLKGD